MATRRSTSLPLVEAIMPELYPTAFDDPAWLFEPKYDGFRGLLYLSGRGVPLPVERGNVLRRFEQLGYWVREELPDRDMVLDGEVVSLDEKGRQDFRALMASRGNLHYAATCSRAPCVRRCSPSRAEAGICSPRSSLDLEGIVAKRLRDAYTPDVVWRKIRNGAYTQMKGRAELFHPNPRSTA
jgi:ATP-dependent DNA ligase